MCSVNTVCTILQCSVNIKGWETLLHTHSFIYHRPCTFYQLLTSLKDTLKQLHKYRSGIPLNKHQIQPTCKVYCILWLCCFVHTQHDVTSYSNYFSQFCTFLIPVTGVHWSSQKQALLHCMTEIFRFPSWLQHLNGIGAHFSKFKRTLTLPLYSLK